MAKPRLPQKVKLVVGLISNDVDLFAEAMKTLEKRFSNKIAFESSIIDFKGTDYYNEELGDALKRKFLGFEKPIDLKDMYKVKLVTNSIEERFSKSGKRRINIDPGYLSLSKLVLLSTKDYSHRIYLDRGIFAEVTLSFKDGTFNPWPWTYPDYQTKEYIDIFNTIRGLYKKDIKS